MSARWSKRAWFKRALALLAAAALAFLAYSLLAVRGTFAPTLPGEQAGGDAVAVGAAGHRIVGRAYLSGAANPSAPLIVILHGDAPFTKPRYQYLIAGGLAETLPGTRVVGLMRPGYADAYGARSDGDRGFAVGENYTAGVARDVADAVLALKRQWQAPAVILVGHSGGAAVAANVAALAPGLVQQAVLVSCPCDLASFRRHMARQQWGPLWLLPTHSLSPLQTLERMLPGTRIAAFTGANDPITPPQYARDYVAKAQSRGIDATLAIVPDAGHEILDHADVRAAIARLAAHESLPPR